jgi:hypothetical protein
MNEFGVLIESNVPIASVSAKMSKVGGTPVAVAGVFQNELLLCEVSFLPSATPSSRVFTVTVVDASGNTYERSFNFTVVGGWAMLAPP